MSQLPVTVLGAGSWGTALALLLAQDTSQTVLLWDRNPDAIALLQAERENRRYLPGFAFPDTIVPTADIADAVQGSQSVTVAVPSSAVRAVLEQVAGYLPATCDIILAAKGMEAETGLLPAEVAEVSLPGTQPIVGLSGPNLAVEVARRIPTAAVAACPDKSASERVAGLYNRPTFRVYTGQDRLGVEIGGAVKNVLAIAGGVSDGLGYGENTKATLLTRGLAEMTRLGVALGADAPTFYGLAGVGDLMATAASRLSRNYRVGNALAKGDTLDTILANLGQVAEGVATAKALVERARVAQVEMPVCRAVYALLFENATPTAAVNSLLARSRRDEWDD